MLTSTCQRPPESPNANGASTGGQGEATRIPLLPHNPYAPRGEEYTDYINFDLSDRDLRFSLDTLLHVRFNVRTKWPERAYLPEGYDPEFVLELGKDPGLELRELHEKGITGQGVGIAIIDTPLLIEHQEYAAQTDPDGYIFNCVGSRSWVMPYLAGVYASAIQIDPALTGEPFWALAMNTSMTIKVEMGDSSDDLVLIFDPRALLEALD